MSFKRYSNLSIQNVCLKITNFKFIITLLHVILDNSFEKLWFFLYILDVSVKVNLQFVSISGLVYYKKISKYRTLSVIEILSTNRICKNIVCSKKNVHYLEMLIRRNLSALKNLYLFQNHCQNS